MPRIDKTCPHCKTVFPCHTWHKKKFCGEECRAAGRARGWKSPKPPGFRNSGNFKPGHSSWNTGTAGTGLMKPNSGSFKKGIVPANKGRGLGNENELQRRREEYRVWRKAVFERDNYTCMKSGVRGGRIVAHHINNFADFPQLRTVIENGITLSEVEHRNFHRLFGRKRNTREQMDQFLGIREERAA